MLQVIFVHLPSLFRGLRSSYDVLVGVRRGAGWRYGIRSELGRHMVLVPRLSVALALHKFHHTEANPRNGRDIDGVMVRWLTMATGPSHVRYLSDMI